MRVCGDQPFAIRRNIQREDIPLERPERLRDRRVGRVPHAQLAVSTARHDPIAAGDRLHRQDAVGMFEDQLGQLLSRGNIPLTDGVITARSQHA